MDLRSVAAHSSVVMSPTSASQTPLSSSVTERIQMSEATQSGDVAELAALFNRITTNAPSAEDTEILKQFLITSGKPGTIQVGKYVVNIGDGKDVRVGNHVYQGLQFDDLVNAITKAQALIETVETDAALQRYFGAL